MAEPYPIPQNEIRPFFVNTARGCVFRCTFCYHVFQKDKYRFRSPKAILAEVKELQGKYSIALVLYDSTLNHLLKNNMKYLGTQTLSSRLNLIKQKMKLDTNHIAIKNQRSYEAQFAVATDDTVLSQFKKETYPTKSKIKSVSENQKSSYDWVYYLTGLSALIITLVLVRKTHKKQPINIQKFLEENPKFIHFQTSMNQMLDEEFLWKDPDCPLS